MDIQKVVRSLHPIERAVLPYLSDACTLSDLLKESSLKEVEIQRALQWLESKKVLAREKRSSFIVKLDSNGELYLKQGLPERRFLEELGDGKDLNELKNSLNLNDEEFAIALGTLKRKNAVILEKGKIKPTEAGKKLLRTGFEEERFLKRLPAKKSSIGREELRVFNELMSRKQILKIEEEKDIAINLTELGQKLLQEKIDSNLIEAVTPDLIKSKNWKGKEFRYYNIQLPVPKIYGGKRHFVSQAISYVRKIWLELGFKEMTGPLVQTSFWNFDTLFTPQDHPSRELQDTFYIKDPAMGALPKLHHKVKLVHETGGKTGSKGWQYKWDPIEARKNILRAHTTCLSARTLSELNKKDLPLKFFSVGKVFRNETLDWSHLFEFYQTEGIVVDRNANLRHLLAYLREFFTKMGFPKARFRPGPFPYVSPAVEVEVYHPVKKTWIELGGAGIFRPEVVEPLLGEYIPVLAWGLGLERIIVDYYGIKDLREVYSNDLKQLRGIKTWMK